MAKKDGYTYRLAKKVNIGDPMDYVIVRGNVEEEVTLRLILDNYRMIAKTLKEDRAKANLADTLIANIEEHHPFVKKMKEQDLHTVYLYKDALDKRKTILTNIDEYERAMKAYRRGWKELTSSVNLDVEFPKD
jgi:transcription initiation factor IIF auxiliary subunit